jgi:integrase
MFTRLTLTDLPAPLRGPVIVDDLGRPRFWAVAWSVLALNDTAPATKEKRLRYLESLYAHSDRKFGLGSLDSSLSLLDMDRLSRILETWFISIANQPKQSSSDEARWQTGYEFVKFVVSWKVRSPVSNGHLKGLQSSLDRLTHLYKQLRVQKPRQADRVRSLPANIVQSLYEHLDPSSKANPFTRNHTLWLVYASFILLLHQGLRRGELLLLSLDAIKSGFDSERNQERFWINIQSNPYEDEDSDPRFTRPSIKTDHSIRQLPVSSAVVHIVQSYVDNYRGRPGHSFLLNSQKGHPLSTESLTKIFVKACLGLPKDIQAQIKAHLGRPNITPHDLRHTCAVIRLNQLLGQGDSMDEATQKLRTFFGWTRASTMPLKYAAAVFDNRLTSVWSEKFDSQIEVLRALS